MISFSLLYFQPFLSGYEANNMVSGKIKLGKDTLATLEGYWDGKISFTDKRKGVCNNTYRLIVCSKYRCYPVVLKEIYVFY